MKAFKEIFKVIVLLFLVVGFYMTFVASTFPLEWGGLGWLIGNAVYTLLASFIIIKMYK